MIVIPLFVTPFVPAFARCSWHPTSLSFLDGDKKLSLDAPQVGLEPTTTRLTGERSAKLSYRGKIGCGDR